MKPNDSVAELVTMDGAVPARVVTSGKRKGGIPGRRDLRQRAAVGTVTAIANDPDQIADILRRIECGETNAEIAESLGIAPSSLTKILNASDVSREAYARAKVESAEALLDRGMRAIEAAAGGSAAEVNRVRLVAQEFARRAAIRNPRYSDRAAIELSGPDGGPIQSQVQIAVYLPDNGRQRLDKQPV